MNGNKLFVDTNIVLYYLKGNREIVDLISDKELVVSCITEIELLSFPTVTNEAQQTLRDFIKDCEVVDLKPEVKELTIEFRRKYKLKLPDSIIIASSYSRKLPLVTADRDFKRVEEADVYIYEI